MRFRSIDKEPLTAQVPPEVAKAVRKLAYLNKSNISVVATELLCRGMGMRPERFGIDPMRRRFPNKPEPVPVEPAVAE